MCIRDSFLRLQCDGREVDADLLKRRESAGEVVYLVQLADRVCWRDNQAVHQPMSKVTTAKQGIHLRGFDSVEVHLHGLMQLWHRQGSECCIRQAECRKIRRSLGVARDGKLEL